MQLRLSGRAGVNPEIQAPPPPSSRPPPSHLPPAASLGEASPSSSIDVPYLTAVISSLTAEKLAAILIQNSALGPSSIVGAPGTVSQQQLHAPPMPHPPFPFHIPPTSQQLIGSMSPEDSRVGETYRAEKHRWLLH